MYVATTPTVYGIETACFITWSATFAGLQQHLPFTVLKPYNPDLIPKLFCCVATTPTVYGIETLQHNYSR